MQRTVDLLLRQQQNVFDPIVIIIELSYRIVYRDNFDLSYRLSIGNSIWHIVTALMLAHTRGPGALKPSSSGLSQI